MPALPRRVREAAPRARKALVTTHSRLRLEPELLQEQPDPVVVTGRRVAQHLRACAAGVARASAHAGAARRGAGPGRRRGRRLSRASRCAPPRSGRSPLPKARTGSSIPTTRRRLWAPSGVVLRGKIRNRRFLILPIRTTPHGSPQRRSLRRKRPVQHGGAATPRSATWPSSRNGRLRASCRMARSRSVRLRTHAWAHQTGG